MDLTALKTELTTDPNGYGYTGNDVTDADLLNMVRDGVSVDRAQIPVSEIVQCLNLADVEGILTDARRQWLQLVLSGDSLDLSREGNTEALKGLKALFPAGSATRTAILALIPHKTSRAIELFGKPVTTSDCARARAEG